MNLFIKGITTTGTYLYLTINQRNWFYIHHKNEYTKILKSTDISIISLQYTFVFLITYNIYSMILIIIFWLSFNIKKSFVRFLDFKNIGVQTIIFDFAF